VATTNTSEQQTKLALDLARTATHTQRTRADTAEALATERLLALGECTDALEAAWSRREREAAASRLHSRRLQEFVDEIMASKDAAAVQCMLVATLRGNLHDSQQALHDSQQALHDSQQALKEASRGSRRTEAQDAELLVCYQEVEGLAGQLADSRAAQVRAEEQSHVLDKTCQDLRARSAAVKGPARETVAGLRALSLSLGGELEAMKQELASYRAQVETQVAGHTAAVELRLQQATARAADAEVSVTDSGPAASAAFPHPLAVLPTCSAHAITRFKTSGCLLAPSLASPCPSADPAPAYLPSF